MESVVAKMINKKTYRQQTLKLSGHTPRDKQKNKKNKLTLAG